ncbi:hypothetical protein ACIOTI_32785 [Streptomyces sp. NPDC087843]|uniref:hypothetical protein n=1 Tax=Streptomyces sp. NPDC087843 TaxID=3365804 RepID=UPI00381F6490
MGRRVMGRRTVGRRTVGRRAPSRYGRALGALALGAALCASAAFMGRASATSPVAESGTPRPYAYAADDTTVEGTTTTTNAARLEPGRTYRSSLGEGGKLYYRLTLDATSNAYVSATAVPGPGATVSYADGVKVSVQDDNGRRCSSSAAAHFGASESPHPVAAWASREIGPTKYSCQTAGTYYMVVERVATSGSSASSSRSPGDWDLELGYVSEPALKKAGSTRAPETWNSASPEALQGDARTRAGGAGFATAGALDKGVWKDRISPGQTLFYRVPVDWGQQFYAGAELGSSTGGDGFVGTALVVSLYNPVRGFVDDVGCGYDGSQRAAALDPLPPVAYENRYALNDRTSSMRFAGSYYLAVHLAAQVAEKFGDGPFGLTLRVRVEGAAHAGPAYAGRADPRDVFDAAAGAPAEVSGGTVAGAGGRAGGSGSGADRHMKVVAAGGLGTGTALLLVLAVWTAVARRRARVWAAAGDAATTASPAAHALPGDHAAPRGR